MKKQTETAGAQADPKARRKQASRDSARGGTAQALVEKHWKQLLDALYALTECGVMGWALEKNHTWASLSFYLEETNQSGAGRAGASHVLKISTALPIERIEQDVFSGPGIETLFAAASKRAEPVGAVRKSPVASEQKPEVAASNVIPFHAPTPGWKAC